jgi:hypothetical protein
MALNRRYCNISHIPMKNARLAHQFHLPMLVDVNRVARRGFVFVSSRRLPDYVEFSRGYDFA